MTSDPGQYEQLNIYLHPGQLYSSPMPSKITTIVGSCVAVCLWDPIERVGGMNHYLLPCSIRNGASSPRFGNIAVRRLIEDLLNLGSSKLNLQAKLFGGACVIEAFQSKDDLGKQNVRIAHNLLAGENIPIISEDVGGNRGRKLIFQTDRGDVWMKLL